LYSASIRNVSKALRYSTHCLSFFTLSFIGLTYLNVSSISSVYTRCLRYTSVSVDAIPSTWRRNVFRSLQMPPGSICVLLFVISWRYRLTASARMVVGLSQFRPTTWNSLPTHLRRAENGTAAFG